MSTESALCERVRASDAIALDSSLEGFALPSQTSPNLSLADHAGIVDFAPADQVVVVRAGALLSDLNREISTAGHTIPYCLPAKLALADARIHDYVDFNLPHALEAQCGSWRDWVLGMRVILADGSVRVCGSRAVKNVAGYDVQKLFVGARGSLGIVAEVTLRTYPLRAIPSADLVEGRATSGPAITIRRCLPSRFSEALAWAGERLIVADRQTATLWLDLDASASLPRQPGEWVIRSGCGSRNLEFDDADQIRLMKRAKEIFDPSGKMCPGAMGIF